MYGDRSVITRYVLIKETVVTDHSFILETVKTLYLLLKSAKPAKPSTRKYQVLRNINAIKDLTAKMSDLDNFLAGVISLVYQLAGVGNGQGVGWVHLRVGVDGP